LREGGEGKFRGRKEKDGSGSERQPLLACCACFLGRRVGKILGGEKRKGTNDSRRFFSFGMVLVLAFFCCVRGGVERGEKRGRKESVSWLSQLILISFYRFFVKVRGEKGDILKKRAKCGSEASADFAVIQRGKGGGDEWGEGGRGGRQSLDLGLQ